MREKKLRLKGPTHQHKWIVANTFEYRKNLEIFEAKCFSVQLSRNQSRF